MNLKLDSPAGAEPIVYSWPLLPSRENDIIETIRWVCEDLPELKIPLERNILCDYNLRDYKSMKKLCDRFNRAVNSVVNLAKGTSLPAQRFKNSPSRGLLRHILQQVYTEAVISPERLNQYKPFSPEVYGETSYDLISQMIDCLDISSKDTFIDLGSGVGQVVLQMAASTSCKLCLGIEKAEVPNAYAAVMERQFKKWMQWYGKKYGKYKLINGDFFDEGYRDYINSSTIVFVNNLAFGPTVDHKLKLIFENFRDGVYIVSSKKFCPLNYRITDRNLSDFATICNVAEMPPLPGAVSWTGSPVSYYVHTIDRTKLEKYFERLKNSNFEEPGTSQIKQDSSTDSGWSDTWSNNSEEVIKRHEKPVQTITKAKCTKAKRQVPRALKLLMRSFQDQYMDMLEHMQNYSNPDSIRSQIKTEQERNQKLQFRVNQITKQISNLKAEGVSLLKVKLREIGLDENAAHFGMRVKAIVQRNYTLREQSNSLEKEIKHLQKLVDVI